MVQRQLDVMHADLFSTHRTLFGHYTEDSNKIQTSNIARNESAADWWKTWLIFITRTVVCFHLLGMDRNKVKTKHSIYTSFGLFLVNF